ncbi:pentatricopeptide repeat-containing protein [Prunus yedoensis var. nudiflora]|uniref:Pentatricopeptide repeat-containing protein n=1 Tax=Prunus yedoensis var. nudiflora TaxID=2094558 RepID=A0A314YZK0_PRUYE|nr:pentatricopeptide repeat-containing protein [Prunus yedoensis var. nudiflora]
MLERDDTGFSCALVMHMTQDIEGFISNLHKMTGRWSAKGGQITSGDMIRPDNYKITIASVLAACAHLGAFDHGIWVHMGAWRVIWSLCGCVDKAYEVFQEMPNKDTLAWTAMISVLALHGFGNEAFDIFRQMETTGVKPNHVTFVGLLSACAHSGLVEKGRWCFHVMKRVYLIEPQLYHYASMVDMLSRAGLIYL